LINPINLPIEKVGMSLLPHDTTDLFLAPVSLELDRRIDELGRLDAKALSHQIALDSDLADWTRDLREEALLRTVGHLIETHHWVLSWDPRGLRLSHQERHVVLGVPDSFRAFLAGAGTVPRGTHRSTLRGLAPT
jgi:hypothetical protein